MSQLEPYLSREQQPSVSNKMYFIALSYESFFELRTLSINKALENYVPNLSTDR